MSPFLLIPSILSDVLNYAKRYQLKVVSWYFYTLSSCKFTEYQCAKNPVPSNIEEISRIWDNCTKLDIFPEFNKGDNRLYFQSPLNIGSFLFFFYFSTSENNVKPLLQIINLKRDYFSMNFKGIWIRRLLYRLCRTGNFFHIFAKCPNKWST